MSATAVLCATCARMAVDEDGASIRIMNTARSCDKCPNVSSPVWLVRWHPTVPTSGTHWGEITAYRAWLVTDDMRLKSTAAGTEWQPGEPMVAHAELQPYRSDIGVHAWKTFERAREYAAGANWICKGGSVAVAMVIGEVELYGDVIEYELGYRASHAAVSAIHNIIGWNGHPMVTPDDVLDNLREVYGVGGEARNMPPMIGGSVILNPNWANNLVAPQAGLRNVYYDPAYQARLAQALTPVKHNVLTPPREAALEATKPPERILPDDEPDGWAVWSVPVLGVSLIFGLVWLASL